MTVLRSGQCIGIGHLASDLIAALGLPAAALVNQRVPKKMLLQNVAHGASIAADRKLIQDHIEDVTWVAALKPANVGVPEYTDAQRAYLEVAVLRVTLRSDAPPADRAPEWSTARANRPAKRVAELMHRAIPYPVVLLLDDGEALDASLAHIRWAQNDTTKTVLDGDLLFTRAGPLPGGDTTEPWAACLAALALSTQPRLHLRALYQGWFDTLSAWQAAGVTGRFVMSVSPEHAAQRRIALRQCRELDARIATLRASASKEKQLARQVAANLEIKALLAERQQAAQRL